MRIILAILCCATVVAAPIIEYNTNTTRVVRFTKRAHTPAYFGRADVVVVANATETNITLPKIAWENVPTNFWTAPLEFKWNGTNLVREGQATLDAEAAAFAASATALAETNLLLSAKMALTNVNLSDPLVLRAVLSVAIDEINALRVQLNRAKTNFTTWTNQAVLPNRTFEQAKNAVLGKIEDGSVR